MSELIKNELKTFENSPLKLLNIVRELVKRGIMNISYGVTIKGIKDQLISDFFIKTTEKYIYTVNTKDHKIEKVSNLYKIRDDKFLLKPDQNFRISGTNIMKLASIIHSTLFQTYPNLLLLVNYLKDINKFLKVLSLNIGFIWSTPSGLIIEQKYMEKETQTQ